MSLENLNCQKRKKVTIVSMILTNSVLNLWTHLAIYDKVSKT
jgi:hypothetical protein